MDDFMTWAIKILIPSLVAISIKLAIQSKKKALSLFNVITSMVIGIGTAYLSADVIITTVSQQYIPIAIAMVTISGEKIGLYLIYKFNVESMIEMVLERMKKKGH